MLGLLVCARMGGEKGIPPPVTRATGEVERAEEPFVLFVDIFACVEGLLMWDFGEGMKGAQGNAEM